MEDRAGAVQRFVCASEAEERIGEGNVGRKLSNSADYFYHRARPGKTLFILQSQWGNDGYAFWFKLLEILTTSQGHFFLYRKPENKLFFDAEMRLRDISGEKILDCLADLGKIDSKLWKDHGVIWCQNLVDGLAETLYKKRNHAAPVKPCFKDVIISPEIPPGSDILTGNENNSTEKEIISAETPLDSKVDREGGSKPTPLFSASPPPEEPQEKTDHLSALRLVNPGLTLTAKDEERLCRYIAAESWETIIAAYRLFWARKGKAFWIFLDDFGEWKKQLSKTAAPAPATSIPALEEMRAEVEQDREKNPNWRKEAALAKRTAHLPLTPEEEELLREADTSGTALPPTDQPAAFPESADLEPKIDPDIF